jgi:ribosomal protein S13
MFAQINPLNKPTAAVEMIIMLFVSYILGYLTHWIICAYRHSEQVVAAEEEADDEDTIDVVSDNLTRIEGIGPKIEKILNDVSIHTFEDVANTSTKQLKTILEEAGRRYQMHDPSSWSRQARLAADGEWAKLKKLQDRLIAGRTK